MLTSAPRHRYTLQDYLDVEEMSEVRHEYFGGEIYAMAGGTPQHAALSAAVIGQLSGRLRGSSCRAYSSDLRLRVPATGLATYPDAAVICGEVRTDPLSPTHVINPTIIFEVLSPSTEDYDRNEKREHYMRLESLRAYVLVAQDRRHIDVWIRTGECWSHAAHGPGETFELAAVGCELEVDALYDEAGLAQ